MSDAPGYQRAYESFCAGQWEDSLDHLRPLLGSDPGAVKSWLLEGRVRAALGEWQAAERAFERACLLDPSDPLAHSELAHFLHVQGRPGDALALLEEISGLSMAEDTAFDLALLKAEALFQMLQAALLEEVVEAEHESSGAQVLPASPTLHALHQQGAQAIAQALQLDPKSPEAWDLKAHFSVVAGEAKDAAKAWQQALRHKPNHPEYLHELAVTLEGLKQLRPAQEAYQQLATLERHREVALRFPPEAFSSLVLELWSALEETYEAILPAEVSFALWVEEIPAQALASRTDLGRPFDPWMPMFLDVEQSNTQAPMVHIVYFQRNIERESDAQTPEELARYLQALSEDCFFLIDALLNGDQLRAEAT